MHTHWQQLQSQWDALHSWQRKNTAAGERKQIQIWHCPLPSCSVRAPVKTDLPVWILSHCRLLFPVYLLRINPYLRRGRDFSRKGRGWGLKQQAESSVGHVQRDTHSKALLVLADPLAFAQRQIRAALALHTCRCGGLVGVGVCPGKLCTPPVCCRTLNAPL